jgi:hypothetical protein
LADSSASLASTCSIGGGTVIDMSITTSPRRSCGSSGSVRTIFTAPGSAGASCGAVT